MRLATARDKGTRSKWRWGPQEGPTLSTQAGAGTPAHRESAAMAPLYSQER